MVGIRWGRTALGLALIFAFSYAQDEPKSPTSWARTYGTREMEFVDGIDGTNDGGAILAGTIYKGAAGWIVKLKADGTIDWQNKYTGNGKIGYKAIRQTTNSGYVVVGVNQFHRHPAPWVVKLTLNGEIEWQWIYESGDESSAEDICQLKDGSYVWVGSTLVHDSLGTFIRSDAWIVKLNADGTRAWDKTFGNGHISQARAVANTPDGGFVVEGVDVPSGVWVMRFDADGKVQWDNLYLGGGRADSIQPTTDGGCVFTASSYGVLPSQVMLVRLNACGAVVSGIGLGGIVDQRGGPVRQTSDGGLVLVTEIDNAPGVSNVGVIKVKSDGAIEWQKQYGGAGSDVGRGVIQMADGGYMVAGYTNSYGAGSFDAWVLKLNPDGSLPSTLWPNPDTHLTVTSLFIQSVSGSHSIVGTRQDTFVAEKTTSVAKPTYAVMKQQAP